MRKPIARLVILAPLLWFAASQPAAAQPQTPLPGTLVRVLAPRLSPVPLTGTLLDSSDRELVVFVPASGKKIIPIDAITKLQWSEGRHNKAGSFAKWGAIGMGVLTAVSFAASSSSFGDFVCESRGGCALLGATLGSISGAMYGALIGVTVRTYDWKDLPVNQGAGGPQAQLAMKWRF